MRFDDVKLNPKKFPNFIDHHNLYGFYRSKHILETKLEFPKFIISFSLNLITPGLLKVH